MSKTTPATAFLRRTNVPFETLSYDYDPSADRLGVHAAAAMGEPEDRVFKTLMTEVDGAAVCVVIPVARELSMKKLAAAAGGKSARMMKPADAERVTGFKVGGISPFGRRKATPTILAREALEQPYIVANGGARGVQVKLSPTDALTAMNGVPGDVLAPVA